MPLLDHFRPPLSQRRHWDSFHGAWAEAIATALNQSLLPERFVAEAWVKRRGQHDSDHFEVQVLHEDAGAPLAATIELVSPANKDRPADRHAFATKCADYLSRGVSVILVDVVTEPPGNLHTELLNLLHARGSDAGQVASDLYAVAHRTVTAPAGLRLETWVHGLSVGAGLPTLPLWLQPELCLPLDLEASYRSACVARRIVS